MPIAKESLLDGREPSQPQTIDRSNSCCRCCGCCAGSEGCCGGCTPCNFATCPGCCNTPRNFQIPGSGVAYLLLVTVEAAITLAFCGVMTYVSFTNEAEGDEIEAVFYSSVAAFIQLAFLYFSYDAVFSENRFQMFASLQLSILMTLYVIFKYLAPFDLGEFWNDWKAPYTATKVGFQVLFMFLAPVSMNHFGYHAFKTVGSDKALQGLYHVFLQFVTLVKMDFILSFVLVAMYGFFFGRVDLERVRVELALDSIAMILTFVLTLWGWIAVTSEKGWMMWMLYFWSLVEPAYIVYKLYCFNPWGTSKRCYVPQQVTLGQFVLIGVLAIMIKLLLIQAAIRCHRNFGKGLKQRVFRLQDRTSV